MADPPAAALEEPAEPVEPLGSADPTADESLVEEELLVEEISIDGMCGVY